VRKNRTASRAANAICWAWRRGVVVGRIVVAIRPPGESCCARTGQRLPRPRESTYFERRSRCEASDARGGACATWRLESVRRSCHVSGVRNDVPDETPSGEREGRLIVHLQLHRLLSSIQSEFARQTCRLYHDLGVGCGCRHA
jgi:hypothetical protein